MKIAILTSQNQWFVSYAEELKKQLTGAEIFFHHKDINISFDIVFILSYHTLIEKQFLRIHKYNLVIHESALPKGKGWAPMFWQILEGKDVIPFTMFEASEGIDNGPIYMQKFLHLKGDELNVELRKKQANMIIDMCIEFIRNINLYCVPIKQKGEESFYEKRTEKDSELDINKTIKEQFNLLRIVDNDNYPAFFSIGTKKYKITIEEMHNENR